MVIAGIIATVLIGILFVFQLALALGAPLGAAAWGGRNPGVLPSRLRIASATVGLVLYPAMAALILAAAGIIDDGWLPFDPTALMWILTAFFALGVLANAASRSPIERIWAPVSAVLAMGCGVIALG